MEKPQDTLECKYRKRFNGKLQDTLERKYRKYLMENYRTHCTVNIGKI